MATKGPPSDYGARLGWSVGLFDWLNQDASKVNRYWRTVEYGSDATGWNKTFMNQRLVGLWGNDAGFRGKLLRTGQLSPFQGGREDQKFVPFFSKLGSGAQAEQKAGRSALLYLTKGGEDLSMLLDYVRTSRHAHPKNTILSEGRDPMYIGRYRNAPQIDLNAQVKKYWFWLMTTAKIEEMPFVSGVVARPVKAGDYYQTAIKQFQPLQKEMDALRVIFRGYSNGKDPSSTAGLQAIRRSEVVDFGAATAKEHRRKQYSKNPGAYTGYVTGVTAGMTVAASARVQDFTRGAGGRFSSFQSEVRQVNVRLAAEFAEEVAGLMATSRRPATGQLIKATKDPRNRYPL